MDMFTIHQYSTADMVTIHQYSTADMVTIHQYSTADMFTIHQYSSKLQSGINNTKTIIKGTRKRSPTTY
jgi:hypothetical protein